MTGKTCVSSSSGETVLKNHPNARLAHFLFLIPFILGLRSLLSGYSLADLVVFSFGGILVTVLIIYGNQRPIVTITEDRLLVYLNYRHTTESYLYDEINTFQKLSPHRIRIISKAHRSASLYLGKKDIDVLIKTLNAKNIHSE